MPRGFRNSSRSISPGWVGGPFVGMRTMFDFSFVRENSPSGNSRGGVALMIIRNFNPFRTIRSPDKTYPKLVVDSNTVIVLVDRLSRPPICFPEEYAMNREKLTAFNWSSFLRATGQISFGHVARASLDIMRLKMSSVPRSKNDFINSGTSKKK